MNSRASQQQGGPAPACAAEFISDMDTRIYSIPGDSANDTYRANRKSIKT